MKIKTGFTIIEVLVVIGIIAVLTAIAFPAINNIRAKNRDTERVADIGTLQIGLALFKSQSPTGEYPKTLPELIPKYVTNDAVTPPTTDPTYAYKYIPLKSTSGNGSKCTYYHLGALLELPSGQIDTADQFSSVNEPNGNGYDYCDPSLPNVGFVHDNGANSLIYAVHP